MMIHSDASVSVPAENAVPGSPPVSNEQEAPRGWLECRPSSTLVERLETAASGGRDMDTELAIHLERKLWLRARKPSTVERDGRQVVIPAYTTSLDAALALADRVLPGLGAWDVGHAYNGEPPHYARLVVVRDGPPEEFGHAATPALALCAAILKATTAAEGPSVGTQAEGRSDHK